MLFDFYLVLFEPANGFELRRLGSDNRLFFQHPHHTTLLPNRAASQVASSEWLARWRVVRILCNLCPGLVQRENLGAENQGCLPN
jgi:hypothetical protein